VIPDAEGKVSGCGLKTNMLQLSLLN
jgi:hypothetical protein